jgi:hypothetical protein
LGSLIFVAILLSNRYNPGMLEDIDKRIETLSQESKELQAKGQTQSPMAYQLQGQLIEAERMRCLISEEQKSHGGNNEINDKTIGPDVYRTDLSNFRNSSRDDEC